MIKIKYILFIFLTMLPVKIWAQQISLNRVSFSQPLPSASVYRIFQDSKGFMWFGTPEGLCRYDGYRIITFKSEYNSPDLLTDNDITSFAEDDHNLWIGTKKGVNILNKRNYIIKHFKDSIIANSEIKFIRVTSDKSVWIGTNRALFKYNGKFPVQQVMIGSMNDLFEDKSGTIWLATWGQGLYKYKVKQDSFEKYPKIGTANNPFKFFQDNKGQLWICTWGDGLYLFNPDKNANEIYHQLPRMHSIRGSDEHLFYSITQDDTYNYIWTLAYGGVYVFKYDDDGKLQPVDMSQLFTKSNNIFSEIIKDHNGNLWIATFDEGLITVNFDLATIENITLPDIKKVTGFSSRISAVYATPNEIWFYQLRHRLGIYYLKENRTLFYDQYQCHTINSFESYPDEFWLGGNNEIFRVTQKGTTLTLKRTIKLTEITDNPGFIVKLYEDRSNNIWIATDLNLFFKPAGSDVVSKIDIPITNLSDITEDTQGNLWISSLTDGICRIVSFANKKFELFNTSKGNLVSDHILSICADKKGWLWIGTKEGHLLRCNSILRKVTEVSELINATSKQIKNIINDDQGNIWFSTNDNITVYNPDNGAFRDFTENDGLAVNSFLKYACYKDKSGKLYFGGNRGICIFNPVDFSAQPHSEGKLIITDVKINNKSVFLNNSNKRFDMTRQYLEIFPDDKNVEIDFSTLNYTYTSKIRYAYKLEGLDKDWIYVQSDHQFAIFSSLPKGTYKLLIKATDENHIWLNETATLTLYRRPAFYETWWAYLIYFCIFASLVYYAYLRTKRRMKLQNSLKIVQIEKEKSEELVQTKLRFFTNIGHEFRTPLTLIMTPLGTLIHQLTDENLKQKLSSIYRNAESMLDLINQLLDFRKLEMGGEKLKLQCDDFVKFTQYVYHTFKDVAENKSIQFTFESDVRQLFMAFDKSKIRKIINNLYSNALKFTPPEGFIDTTIKLMQENGREFVRMDISDSGCGITEKEQQMIFERFYQSENNLDKPGSGIGLHMVKEYVELHGGQISVSSKTGMGSTFSVIIPADLQVPEIKADTPAEHEQELAVYPLAGYKSNEQEKKTLLVVEDNAELRRFLTEQLSGKFNVLQASDGKQGGEIALKKLPDLIVSDLMMPVQNGLEMCQNLKNNINTSHIPIILLTAKLSDETKIESYKSGADSFIPKPFNFEVLQARIEMLIEQQEKRRNLFHKTIEITPSSITTTSLDEELIRKALLSVEKNMDNSEYSVDGLALDLAISRQQLHRKFQSIIGLSPSEFIRSVRLKQAAQLLKDSQYNISEVSYMVGFSTIKYFNQHFKEEFGVTPTQYRTEIPKKTI